MAHADEGDNPFGLSAKRYDEIVAAAKRIGPASRRAQGLPEKVTDRATIDQIAVLLRPTLDRTEES